MVDIFTAASWAVHTSKERVSTMVENATVHELTHFVGGKRVPGTSDRFADVFDPNTGKVQARVPLASKTETEAIIANAEEAQQVWAAFNPQKRARVLMKFLQLAQAEMDSLARLLSSEHGKTVADAKGDIQRGLEVIEFAVGAPHLLKGEFTESAGTGIDVYSMRQPPRRRCRHHALQLPRDDPAVEGRPRPRRR